MSNTKKIILRAGIVLGAIIVIALIANAVAIWIYSKPIEDRIAQIKAAGEPVFISDLASESGAAGNDAAILLQDAKQDVDAVHARISPVLEKQGLYRGQLSTVDQRILHMAFEAHPNLFPALQKTARASHYSVSNTEMARSEQFMEAQLQRVQYIRAVATVLGARATLLSVEGQPDAALETCVTLLRLCHHFDQEPGTMFHLVGLACRSIAVECANLILRGGEVSAEMHQALDAELAKHDLDAALREALREERVLGLLGFQEIIDRVGYWPMRVMWLGDMRDYLDLVDMQLEMAEKPFHIVIQTGGNADTSEMGTLTTLAIPPFLQTHEATARTAARIRALRILNAIVSRSNGAGDLAPHDLGLPEDATQDPYSGKPLSMKQIDAGWVIYSVGADLNDDGGSLTDDQDVGVGPISDESLPQQ